MGLEVERAWLRQDGKEDMVVEEGRQEDVEGMEWATAAPQGRGRLATRTCEARSQLGTSKGCALLEEWMRRK